MASAVNSGRASPNATRLTDKWARFLRDHHFTVGVSLDGPAEVHDQTRVDAAGRPTYARVREGMAVLDRFGVGYGVLIVADQEVIDRGAAALLDFIEEVGVTTFGVLPSEQRINEVSRARGSRFSGQPRSYDGHYAASGRC